MSLSGTASSDKTIVGQVGVLNTIHGKSAYEIALINGFEGTEEEWVASLKGEKGDTYILTEADKEEIADIVVADTLEETAEAYIDSVIEEKDLEVTRTATGSAITIDSANAPLQQLKLYGKTEQDGTPTPDAPIDLVSVGDSGSFEVGVYGGNLFKPTVKTVTQSGITLVIDKDGIITIDGTSTGNTFIENIGSFTCSGKLTFTPNFIGKSPSAPYILFNPDGNGDVTVYGVTTFEKTTNRIVNAGLVLYAGTYSNFVLKPMLNIGETSLPFEPFNKQTLTITDTLRGIGEFKDEKDFTRGIKTQRAYAVDLSTLEWNTPSDSIFSAFLPYSAIGTSWAQTSNILCTHYKPTCVAGNGMGVFDGGDDCISLDAGASVNYIFVKDSSYTDIASFKASLSGVYLIYPLETPIETPLTEQELNAYRQLYTNKGTTTILSECEDTEVTYYVNKPNAQAIGNIHSQANKDYLKIQNAIISLGGNV